MQELFRFYAIRAAEPLSQDEHIALETSTRYQASLRAPTLTVRDVVAASRAAIDQGSRAVLHDLDTFGGGMSALKRRLDGLPASAEGQAPVDEWVRTDFKRPLAALVEILRGGTEQLKDVLLALRVLRMLDGQSSAVVLPAARVARSTTTTHSLAQNVPQLMLHLRLRTALAGAASGPVTVAYMKKSMSLPMTHESLDRLPGIMVGPPPTPAQPLAEHRRQLRELTELITQVRLASPGGLTVSAANTVLMVPARAIQLAAHYKTLISSLAKLPGVTIPTNLSMPFAPLHQALEDKAKSLQQLIDDETPAAPVAASPLATSPTIGGHLQLSGVADVHVVLNHVIGYEKAQLAQIENILLGELRDRTYRTLLRSETDTEDTTETTTTQEREVKTEDRSDLKSETNDTLKEVLDLKAGLDVQYKQGDSLKLNINASVAYNRTKEETNKVATEFAKNVTNRAAQKVVENIRKSIKVKLLRETEETVKHSFDNTGVTRTENIAGIYQWIEKIFENVHLTVGGPAAIFDGVVLQPAQRLLTAPPAADGALGSCIPPPVLDVTPSDIHSWNYLSLAAKFAASGVPPPPPFTSTSSFSSAAGDANHQGIAHDLALADDAVAAWAAIVFDAIDKKSDTPDHAEARASIGSNKLESVTVNRHATQKAVVLLAGERTMVPFAALFYDTEGHECTVDVTCVRTPEAYERWQLSVYAALSNARVQAQQAYDERVARATLQQSYKYGPSPGRVEQLIREELKRCAIGVLAKQAAGKNIFERLGDLYATGQTAEVARLCLIYEHAFAWENMSYVLYPYFWADNGSEGWALHTARSESDANWADFLRCGAARVVVPVRDGFVRLEALGVTPPGVPTTPPGPNPLQLLQEDISAILDETLTFDDLLSVSSSKALSAAKESALRAQVLSQWVEHEHWFVRTPTELVILRPLSAALPKWEWNTQVDLSQGIARAWLDKP